jgi:hypothetical protein
MLFRRWKTFYAPLVMVSLLGRKRTLADKTVYQCLSIDTTLRPPLFSLDSTFKFVYRYHTKCKYGRFFYDHFEQRIHVWPRIWILIRIKVADSVTDQEKSFWILTFVILSYGRVRFQRLTLKYFLVSLKIQCAILELVCL